MQKVTFELENYLYAFYEKVGKLAGKTAEEVMKDMLFRLAGEASLQSLDAAKRKKP